MYNKLIEEIKKMKGNVLVICLDDKITSAFEKNYNVNLYSISNSNSKSTSFFKKSKRMKTKKGKTINIKRLKKYLNKKTLDYIIINFDEIIDYYKFIIRDSIALSKNKIIIYSNNTDKDFITYRYKRYNIDYSVVDYKNGYIIDINNKDNRSNYLKNKIYFLKDSFYNVAEFIGNILIS